jgi:hypothetical protein
MLCCKEVSVRLRAADREGACYTMEVVDEGLEPLVAQEARADGVFWLPLDHRVHGLALPPLAVHAVQMGGGHQVGAPGATSIVARTVDPPLHRKRQALPPGRQQLYLRSRW